MGFSLPVGYTDAEFLAFTKILDDHFLEAMGGYKIPTHAMLMAKVSTFVDGNSKSHRNDILEFLKLLRDNNRGDNAPPKECERYATCVMLGALMFFYLEICHEFNAQVKSALSRVPGSGFLW